MQYINYPPLRPRVVHGTTTTSKRHEVVVLQESKSHINIFSLPCEVRLLIYMFTHPLDYVSVTVYNDRVSCRVDDLRGSQQSIPSRKGTNNDILSIIMTCRRMMVEYSEFIYKHHIVLFYFTELSDPSQLKRLGEDNLASLHRIKLLFEPADCDRVWFPDRSQPYRQAELLQSHTTRLAVYATVAQMLVSVRLVNVLIFQPAVADLDDEYLTMRRYKEWLNMIRPILTVVGSCIRRNIEVRVNYDTVHESNTFIRELMNDCFGTGRYMGCYVNIRNGDRRTWVTWD